MSLERLAEDRGPVSPAHWPRNVLRAALRRARASQQAPNHEPSVGSAIDDLSPGWRERELEQRYQKKQ